MLSDQIKEWDPQCILGYDVSNIFSTEHKKWGKWFGNAFSKLVEKLRLELFLLTSVLIFCVNLLFQLRTIGEAVNYCVHYLRMKKKCISKWKHGWRKRWQKFKSSNLRNFLSRKSFIWVRILSCPLAHLCSCAKHHSTYMIYVHHII